MIPGIVASGVHLGVAAITELFSDADGTNLNGKTTTTGSKLWTVGGGAFDCNTGQGRPTTVTGSAYATIASGLADFDYGCDITVQNGLDGFVFRFVDASNYWRIGLDPGDAIHVVRAVAGTETEPATYTTTINAGVTYRLRLVCTGSSIQTYLDGVLKGTVTDASHSTATKHGIIAGSTSTRFDNISIT